MEQAEKFTQHKAVQIEIGIHEGQVIVDTMTGHIEPVKVFGEALNTAEAGAQVSADPEYDPEQWYTPSVKYDDKFYELGNVHYVPEDSEHARNPMFRNTREFQEQLKLEVKCQEIYMDEYARGALQPWHLKAEFRKQQLETALHALDQYYDGTVIDKDESTSAE